jgi:hypothetical protein
MKLPFGRALEMNFLWIVALIFTATPGRAQDALFEFTGKDPTEPKNWQRPLNWNLNGESAARVPGTGPNDRVVISGFQVSSPTYTIKSLILTGTITGGFLNVTDGLTLNGGTFEACTVTVLDNATFTSSAAGQNQFNSCVVNNRGVFGAGSVKLDSLLGLPPTQLNNDPITGRIELRDGSVIASTSGGAIVGGGVIVKMAGEGSATLPGVSLTLTQSGTLECQGGTIFLGTGAPEGRFICNRPIALTSASATIEISGAASELQAGTTIAGPGRVVAHHVTVSGGIEVENMEVRSHDVLEGPGTISLNGLLTVTGGALNGASGETSPGGLLNIRESGTLRFVHDFQGGGGSLNRNVQNFGTFLQEMNEDVGQTFGVASVPTFRNDAGAKMIFSGSGGLGVRALVNEGTIRKIGNSDLNHTQFLSRTCENSGLIDVQTGLLRFVGLNQAGGELRLAAGAEARLQASDGSTVGGIISGAGTFRASAPATVTGTIRPGSPTGILTLMRTEEFLTFAPSAKFEIEIGGPTLGVDYDQVLLSASVPNFSLAGTVAVKIINNFAPTLGQTFSIVRYLPGRVGTFSSISGLGATPGILLVPRYTATTLDLVATVDPHLRIAGVTSESVIATIETAAGAAYQYETTTDFDTAWSALGPAISGDGQTHATTLNFTPGPTRYFRVRIN